MFKKILIANRGEIAIRVIRSCREMGILTAAVYSEADRNSLHVMLADEAYFIGPAPSSESYLNIERILEVAEKAKVDAVHPGYGFLSESPKFARALNEKGLVFIGAKAEQIEAMGDKLAARELMEKAKVPVVPGSSFLKTEKEALKAAKDIGYPVILKASAGGGGKGIRIVRKESEMEDAFKSCQFEGKNYFNDDRLFAEKFIQNPKHIEVQVFGDEKGNVVHLFERECSIQRRNQKIIEEAPSPSLTEEIRQKLTETALRAAEAISYSGAGTIEFIFDNKTKEFYFMEMNTRLQVEHAVTEMITGQDLVKEQIRVAQGLPLSFTQKDLSKMGHAIELRICAEDPVLFTPSPGKIRRCRIPQGPFVRVDHYIYPGYEIPVHYDPMIAKLIVWGKTRKECVSRIERALAEFMITGIKTNVMLHRNILSDKKFISGNYTTQYIEEELVKRKNKKEFFMFIDDRVFLISAAITAFRDNKSRSVSYEETDSLWRKNGRKDNLRN